MAVFELTSGTDLFLGIGSNADHFVGIPILKIAGVDYSGETGGSDSINGGDGSDHLYLGANSMGTFDGGGGAGDVAHFYGDLTFGTIYVNWETLDLALDSEDDEVAIGSPASLLAEFTNITGHIRIDGRVHMEVNLNADVDFGAKMDSGAAGISVTVTNSLIGSYELAGTKYDDYYRVEKTSSSAEVSYYGNGGNDTFVSDIDGGFARFFGGAGSDTFIVTSNFSFLGQFLEIDAGESSGDNDTLVSTNGNLTDKAITGIETLKGTHNWLTPEQAASIAKFTSEDGGQAYLSLRQTSTLAVVQDYTDKAPNGLGLDTSMVAGKGSYTLSKKADSWVGNDNVAETVHGVAQADQLKVVAKAGDGATADKVFGDKGSDKIVVDSQLQAGETSKVKVDGGDGHDKLGVGGTGRISHIKLNSVESLEFFVGSEGKIYGELAQMVAILVFDDVEVTSEGNNRAQANAADKFIAIGLEGAGGKLDVTAKAEGLGNGVGVHIDGSALTSAIDLTGSNRADELVGTSFKDKLNGGKNSDTVIGGDGKDVITGGRGSDTVSGGGGADKFVFDAKLGSSNIDRIEDFKHNTDKLQLDDAVFKAIGIKLDSAEFYAAKGATKAHDTDDRIIYDTKSGKLSYDADGKGGDAAVVFAVLAHKPSLDAGDFAVV